MSEERVSKKQWGVDLYTVEQLIIRLEEINLHIDRNNCIERQAPVDKQIIKMRDAFKRELDLRKEGDPRAEAKRLIDDIIEKYVFENGSYLDEREDVVAILREYQNRYRRSIGLNPRSD